MSEYILRLDDLSEYSDLQKWRRILDLCSENDIRCLIGVIPKCEDKKLMTRERVDENGFWFFIKHYSGKHDIAMHGFNHEIFGGKSYDKQFKLMSESMKMFVYRKVIPDCFIAPKHIYDTNTLRAMRSLGIGYLSDGIGIYPWKNMDYDIIHVPQILWKPRDVPIGVATFCLHPDTMSEDEMKHLAEFIAKNKRRFISIYDVVLTPLEFLNFVFDPIYIFLYRRRFNKKPTTI